MPSLTKRKSVLNSNSRKSLNRRKSSDLNSEKSNKSNLSYNNEKWSIIQKGINSIVKVKIPQNQKIRIENGAILTMNKDVDLDVTSNFLGGFLTNQSMIQTFAVAVGSNATLTLAPESYGDTTLINIGESGPITIMTSCYLASSNKVRIDVKSQSLTKTLLSGSGLAVMNASGEGIVAIHGSGGIEKIKVRPGDRIKVDNGHLVAWENGVNYEITKASSKYFSSWASGEGFMCEFTGHGHVYIQSRRSIREMVINLINKYGNNVQWH